MPLLAIEKASLAFGLSPLLDAIDLLLTERERIGLIGRNGGGKSSLLRAIAGEIKLDDGIIRHAPNTRVAYVAQEPQLDSSDTVYAAVAQGLGKLAEWLLEYNQLLLTLNSSQNDFHSLDRLQFLQTELETHDGWRAQSTIEAVLSRLNLAPHARISELSGGWRKRVALGRALVMQPDILLLDEPTNHLDISAIEWLEQLLNEFNGSVIFVTHDRRFLDNVATRIIELDRGRLTDFPGQFSAYQEKKAELLKIEAIHAQKFDKVLAQEEAWIRKGVQARCTRNEGRVRRLEALRRERTLRRERLGSVNIAVEEAARSGKLVAELNQVSKSYAEKVVIKNFSTRIMRGDKIGLIGPNGVGKTTLLKLLLGEIKPDYGYVHRGTKLAVAYFDQLREQLDEEATLAETINQGAEFIEINGQRKHVISYLEDFLFPPQRARAPVKTLSGGERNRLLLARLFSRPANVLVLDEPTNDLDIETLELLESLLQDFGGTLFLVSHDRTFLDNVVTQIIAFEGAGELIESAGGYNDWVAFKKRSAKPVEKAASQHVKQTAHKPSSKAKLSFQENKELLSLPQKIEVLEKEQADINARLCDDELYRSNMDEIKRLHARHAQIEDELLACMNRWEELENKV